MFNTKYVGEEWYNSDIAKDMVFRIADIQSTINGLKDDIEMFQSGLTAGHRELEENASIGYAIKDLNKSISSLEDSKQSLGFYVQEALEQEKHQWDW
jgi:midasin (ATPase involved in ribosome maturation)